MNRNLNKDVSLSDVHRSVETAISGPKWKQLFVFFGPAYLISVGYMDPGNWATDLAGGSRYGYTLIWVLLMSNLMALLLQSLSARLGIVCGRDLAQANRETYPKAVNRILYVLAEIAITACDLAEVIGMAIGIQLLTGLPLAYGVVITALDTFLLLFLQKLGMRKMEAFVIGLIAVVGLSFLIEILIARPDARAIASGLIPRLPGRGALYIAIGIIGATVMPHNLYLHSALVQTRRIQEGDLHVRRAIKLNFLDSTLALNLAFLVNVAILILAAAVFYTSGRTSVASIREAHQLLAPLLGNTVAPRLFAIALIAAGQSSTLTGTLAGQIVMEGYLHLRINPVLRRLITRLVAIVPAIVVVLVSGEDKMDDLLVLSQVILSGQLGFAIIPLIHFVSDKNKMGQFVIGPWTKFLSWVVASILIYLNLKLIFDSLVDEFAKPGGLIWKTGIATAALGGLSLILYIFLFPWLRKRQAGSSIQLHKQPARDLEGLQPPSFRKVGIALDFSEHDEKLIAFAVGQGSRETSYLLIHIVESASARMLGRQSADFETRDDQHRLESYQTQMRRQGYRTEFRLGYEYRTKEIVRIVKEDQVDLLVIGAHGHAGLKDFIYGETVNSVRHELKIPVLIVNL